MINEKNICSIAKGCCAITTLMLTQKYVKLGTVRMTLENTNVRNMEFPSVISQLNVIDNYAIDRQLLVVIENCNSIVN